MSTQCPHGQLARQCLLCEQAAEIERLTALLTEVSTVNPGRTSIGDELLDRIDGQLRTMTVEEVRAARLCRRCGVPKADAAGIWCTYMGRDYGRHLWPTESPKHPGNDGLTSTT